MRLVYSPVSSHLPSSYSETCTELTWKNYKGRYCTLGITIRNVFRHTNIWIWQWGDAVLCKLKSQVCFYNTTKRKCDEGDLSSHQKIHQYSHRKYRTPMWNNFQNFRLKSLLHLKPKSTEFQKGRILPQLLTDPHPGNSEYPQLLEQGRSLCQPWMTKLLSVELICVIMSAMVSRVQPRKAEKRIPNHVH